MGGLRRKVDARKAVWGNDGRRKLRREAKFNYLVSFVRSGFPLPLTQRVLGRLREQGMAALDLDRRYLSIGSDQNVGSYYALDFHGAGDVGILRNHSAYNLATAFGSFLSKGVLRR
jgi:hypothetical protein